MLSKTQPSSIARVHYSNKVMKKIFAKQILNKEFINNVKSKNEGALERIP